jgi:ParB/RepB/Spo0J family partition protein
MAKRKVDAAMLLKAGENAHLHSSSPSNMSQSVVFDKTYPDDVSHAKLLEIEVNKIKNNPLQPRLTIDPSELLELSESIKKHGLIHPISVIKDDEGYTLRAGQRRWEAHKLAGLEKIKAIVVTGDINPKELFEIAIAENQHRANIDPLEFAIAVQTTLDAGYYENFDQVSESIGKSKSYISKILKVLSLSPAVLVHLRENKATNDVEALYELQKIKDPDEQMKFYLSFVSGEIDRSDLRAKTTFPKKDKPFLLYDLKKQKAKVNLDIKKIGKEAAVNALQDLIKQIKNS